MACGICLTMLAAAAGAQRPAKPGPAKSVSNVGAPTFGRDIRPIFQARCTVCHSAATVSNPTVSGGLALDTYSAVKQGVAGSKPTPVLVLGKSDKSELYTRLIASSPARLMPKGGPPLPAAQIALIKRWIESNAPEGEASSATPVSKATAESSPMPANRPVLDVTVATKAELAAGLLEKGSGPLTLALKVGPLPPVTSLAYSPDGKTLAIGGYRCVAVWDTATGQPVTCITHLPSAVLALAFKPDGALLAVGGGVPGASGDVRLFSTKDWSQSGKTLGGHTDAVASVCWSQDGTRIASGSQDKSARVWEWPSAKELRVFKDHSDGVSRVCFAPDGKSLYTASLDHNARRFDIEKGGLIRLFTGHNESITALAISPDGKRIVTSGGEPNLRWWNTDTGDTTNNNGGHGASVAEVAFAKDGKLVVSASADKSVRLWDGGNTQPKSKLDGSSDWVYATAISPDDKMVVGGGADGVVRMWEAATGRLRLSLLYWPPAKDSAQFEWAAMTSEGYFDSSAGWGAKVAAANSAKGATAAQLKSALSDLRQPPNVLKAWQAAVLEPAKPPIKK
jgi:hypothetical protein